MECHKKNSACSGNMSLFTICVCYKAFKKKGVDFKSTNISRRYVTAVNRLTDTNKKSQAFRKLITSEIIIIINTIGAL